MQRLVVVVWRRANAQLAESEVRKQVSIPKCRVRASHISPKFSAIETNCTCTPPDDRLVGLKLEKGLQSRL